MKAVLVIAGLSAAAAFHARPPTRAAPRRATPPLNTADELSPVDEMCIENVAEFCLHETCDVEEYEALINQLEEQKMHFIKHVANVENLLVRLKDSNHPEHNPDDVKVLIGNIKETLENPPPAVNGSYPPAVNGSYPPAVNGSYPPAVNGRYGA